jgi:hypothetical protein
MVIFLNGVSACAAAISALMFVRFWRNTADRLFLWFALAFSMFAINYAALGMVQPAEEAHHWLYVIRLTGFTLILAAVVDKNREDD